MSNPYIVTKIKNVKLNLYGNTTDGISLWESEYPKGVTLYYVGVQGDLKWRRFLTQEQAIKDSEWLNKRHNKILELSNGKVRI